MVELYGVPVRSRYKLNSGTCIKGAVSCLRHQGKNCSCLRPTKFRYRPGLRYGGGRLRPSPVALSVSELTRILPILWRYFLNISPITRFRYHLEIRSTSENSQSGRSSNSSSFSSHPLNLKFCLAALGRYSRFRRRTTMVDHQLPKLACRIALSRPVRGGWQRHQEQFHKKT
jgi:hypothetical protein